MSSRELRGACSYCELVRAINDPEHSEQDDLVEIFEADRLDLEKLDLKAAREGLALHWPIT